MNEISELILHAGRAGVELAFFVLLPVMIVMLTFMRLLEARGVLDWIVRRVSPWLLPFGIPGLGVFALIQILFVSFAAPLATLTMINKSGISRRHIAATLALVLAGAQANVTFPMSAVGLNGLLALLISALSAILAAALTYHWFARNLPEDDQLPEPVPEHPVAEDTKGVLAVINSAGKEAFNISVTAIPMLVLALLLVNILRSSGTIGLIEGWLVPVFNLFDLPSSMLLPIITKYIAGGTAMMGVTIDYINQGLLTKAELNQIAGFLIHPLDLAGIAIYLSAGGRVASVLKPALYGAVLAILFRSVIHFLVF
ncbi:MAG: nucleoside recognition family protein [Candidatus Thiodiazotropha taylori]|nr:nucleoside recognition family protein [Candidatus Thiodiazotropha taylori]MCG8105615.1 nucleoside recognition family protein [Candidatus Thiodiazotropha taylori]MCG8111149.1 nucleoside recognition family protein [Candidatus Thiodiazotropha taylori]MCW4277952.1 nucleoside recognition family protein [Candidatus Thiodiazotropha taylori]MCW4283501.1 nucleoside recognition family protein [Candidatus Thiodiazotropha taylori]